MKKRFKKKTLSSILSIIMVLLMSSTVLAAESVGETPTSASFALTTGENVSFYENFSDALTNATDGSVIKLLKDYVDYNSVTINKSITLDLNGKTWNQPSSGQFDIKANVTFTDSVGGGYLEYGLNISSPVTFSGGTYRYIGILYETDDTLTDYLDKCCYYYRDGELLELSSEKYSGGQVTIKPNHTGGTATCTEQAVCTTCQMPYGELLGHTYDQETATADYLKSAAGCTNAAVYYKSCSCGASSKDTTDEITFTSGSATGHSYEKTWSYDKDNHWRECSCGDKADYAKHIEKVINAKDTTTSEKGYTGDRVCEICGYEIAKGEEIPVKASPTTPDSDITPPDTGDNSNILLWFILLFVSGIYLTGISYVGKRKINR